MECYVFNYTMNLMPIAEVEALAQAYYDALDAEDAAGAEEITQ